MADSYFEPYNIHEGDLLISTDRDLLDFELIRNWLAATYWTPDISADQLHRQTNNSTLVFGLYRLPGLAVGTALEAAGPQQIGFCRVLSDLTRLAYLCDVLIAPDEQRKGLGTKLVAAVMQHPELLGIRKWLLATKDAHGVYAKLGFEPLPNPDAYMVLKPKDAIWV
jgi:GNAT superfamily N-acetyltransferase